MIEDAIFAKKMYEMHIKHGWPYNVAVQWNKTRPDRILKVAREFKEIAPVGASMQSFDENALSAVKRKNLTFKQILDNTGPQEVANFVLKQKKLLDYIVQYCSSNKMSNNNPRKK